MKHLKSKPQDRVYCRKTYFTMQGDRLHFYVTVNGRNYAQMDGEWFSLSQKDVKNEDETFMAISATLGKYYFRKSSEDILRDAGLIK